MGPTMFYWMRFAAILFPGRSFKSSISKAITEQFTVDPACICAFLYLMTLFEGKSRQEANHEVICNFSALQRRLKQSAKCYSSSQSFSIRTKLVPFIGLLHKLLTLNSFLLKIKWSAPVSLACYGVSSWRI